MSYIKEPEFYYSGSALETTLNAFARYAGHIWQRINLCLMKCAQTSKSRLVWIEPVGMKSRSHISRSH